MNTLKMQKYLVDNDTTLESVPTGSHQDEIAQLKSKVTPTRRDYVMNNLALSSPLFLLIVWELLVRFGLLDARFFPAPSGIATTFWMGVLGGEIWEHTIATLRRVGIGYAMGVIPALVFGIALSMWRGPRRILMPIFNTLYTIPKIAILPLLLFIFGVGDMSKFMIIAIGSFFLVFFNTINGVMQAPAILFDVARNAGASTRQLCCSVAFPAALPSIFTGLKLAMGQAYVLIAATEFVGAKSGIGYYIWMSWQVFDVKKMFVGIVLLSAIGYISITILTKLNEIFVPYIK